MIIIQQSLLLNSQEITLFNNHFRKLPSTNNDEINYQNFTTLIKSIVNPVIFTTNCSTTEQKIAFGYLGWDPNIYANNFKCDEQYSVSKPILLPQWAEIEEYNKYIDTLIEQQQQQQSGTGSAPKSGDTPIVTIPPKIIFPDALYCGTSLFPYYNNFTTTTTPQTAVTPINGCYDCGDGSYLKKNLDDTLGTCFSCSYGCKKCFNATQCHPKGCYTEQGKYFHRNTIQYVYVDATPGQNTGRNLAYQQQQQPATIDYLIQEYYLQTLTPEPNSNIIIDHRELQGVTTKAATTTKATTTTKAGTTTKSSVTTTPAPTTTIPTTTTTPAPTIVQFRVTVETIYEEEQNYTCNFCHITCKTCFGPESTQCTSCPDNKILDIDTMSCMDACSYIDLSNQVKQGVLFNLSNGDQSLSPLIGTFCRKQLIYYVNPTSIEYREYGTQRYPFTDIIYVLRELYNYLSNTQKQDVIIYLRKGTCSIIESQIENSSFRLINLSSLKILPYETDDDILEVDKIQTNPIFAFIPESERREDFNCTEQAIGMLNSYNHPYNNFQVQGNILAQNIFPTFELTILQNTYMHQIENIIEQTQIFDFETLQQQEVKITLYNTPLIMENLIIVELLKESQNFATQDFTLINIKGSNQKSHLTIRYSVFMIQTGLLEAYLDQNLIIEQNTFYVQHLQYFLYIDASKQACLMNATSDIKINGNQFIGEAENPLYQFMYLSTAATNFEFTNITIDNNFSFNSGLDFLEFYQRCDKHLVQTITLQNLQIKNVLENSVNFNFKLFNGTTSVQRNINIQDILLLNVNSKISFFIMINMFQWRLHLSEQTIIV
eukprot:403363697